MNIEERMSSKEKEPCPKCEHNEWRHLVEGDVVKCFVVGCLCERLYEGGGRLDGKAR